MSNGSSRHLGREVVPGLTIWALLVPSALAYSSIVGVGPQVGLIGVPAALLAYAVFGGTRIMVVGADAAVSAMVGSAVASGVAPQDRPAAVAATSILVGLTFVVLRVFRFGWIADVVPRPVMKGFVQGLALTTSVAQLPDLLGLSPVHGGFGRKVVDIGRSLGDIHGPTAAVGVTTLVVLLVTNRWPRVPAAMICLVGSGIAVALFDLESRGVAVVGAPTSGLEIATPWSVDGATARALVLPAIAIAVVAFTEHLGASQMVSDADGEVIDPNHELSGLGASNLATGLVGSYPVTGAVSKTAVAISAGARSQLANVIVAGLAVLTAVFLLPLFDFLGKSALAAVVIWAMLGTVDVPYLVDLWHSARVEFWVAAVTFAATLAFGIMPAVGVGTALALFLLARHVSRPASERLRRRDDGRWVTATGGHSSDSPTGFAGVRFEGPLVFVNARVAANRLLHLVRADHVDVVALDCSAITAVDSTGVTAIAATYRRMAARGQELWLAEVPDATWDLYVRLAPPPIVPRYLDLDAALDAFEQRSRAAGSAE